MNDHSRQAARLWTLALPAVAGFVASQVRDLQDRDDILQETAVAVFDSFDRYSPGQPFVAWAVGIARNQVLLYFRRKNRERTVFDPQAMEALVSAFSEPEILKTNSKIDFLGECMQGLDDQSRELCRLRYTLDMKPATIADRFDTTANNVAKTLQRIRDRLRDCIERKTHAMESGL